MICIRCGLDKRESSEGVLSNEWEEEEYTMGKLVVDLLRVEDIVVVGVDKLVGEVGIVNDLDGGRLGYEIVIVKVQEIEESVENERVVFE